MAIEMNLIQEIKFKVAFKIKNYFVNHWKLMLVILSVVLLLPLLVMATFAFYQNFGGRIVSDVNGQIVRVRDIKKVESKYEKAIKLTNDQNMTESELMDIARKRLIDELAVKTTAKKFNISVSKEEIDKKIDEDIKNFSSKEAYLEVLKNTYGYDIAEARDRAELLILKEKVSEKVLNVKAGKILFVRFDIDGDNKEKNIALLAAVSTYREKLLKGESVEKLKSQLELRYPQPLSGLFEFTQLNEATEKFTFDGRQDWENIKLLKKTGEISPVYKTDSGYYGFAVLTSNSAGEYDSWEQYLQTFDGYEDDNLLRPENLKKLITGLLLNTAIADRVDFESFGTHKDWRTIYRDSDGSTESDANRLKRCQDLLNASGSTAGNYVRVSGASNGCVYKDETVMKNVLANHRGAIKGKVLDPIDGTAIAGANVNVHYDHDHWAFTPATMTGYTVGSTTMNFWINDSDTSGGTTGTFIDVSNYVVGTLDGKTTGDKELNCWWYYHLSADKNGYNSVTKTVNFENGTMNTYDFNLYPTYHWDSGSWSSCSAICGSGTQTRAVSCKHDGRGMTVDDSYCDASTKPATSQSCNTQACPTYSWSWGNWGSCSLSCGGGNQSRPVACIRSTDSATVADAFCTAAKPDTSQSCNTQSCGAICTPSCSAAPSYCSGVSFDNGCGGTCGGTKYCPPPELISSCSVTSFTANPNPITSGLNTILSWIGSFVNTAGGKWLVDGAERTSGFTTDTINSTTEFSLTGVSALGTQLCGPYKTKVTVNQAPSISCSVTPVGGNVPLTAKFTYDVKGGTLTKVNLNKDGSFFKALNPTGSPFFFSLDTPGKYTFEAVTDFGTDTCANSAITVNNPNDGSGGEVRP